MKQSGSDPDNSENEDETFTYESKCKENRDMFTIKSVDTN